jgi:hypothetical protein
MKVPVSQAYIYIYITFSLTVPAVEYENAMKFPVQINLMNAVRF